MRETEITVEVLDTLENIDKVLRAKGFEIIEKLYLNDYYFSKLSSKKIQSLSYPALIKNSFVVRSINNDESIELMFKDKKVNKKGVVVSEEKLKCHIDNFENAIKLFSLSGLNCWCNLRQELLIYKNATIQFALQIVEDLGIFIEYEEDNLTQLSEKEKIDFMTKNLKELGLNLGDDYSCKKVYMKLKKDNGDFL